MTARRVADLQVHEIAEAAWSRRSWSGTAIALGFSQTSGPNLRIRALALGICEDIEALDGWGKPGRKIGEHTPAPVEPVDYLPAVPVDLGGRPWVEHANCRGVDPDLFFPERGEDTKAAKAVCAGCVVRAECLEEALSNVEKFGIWGGTSERERRKIRKQRYLSAPAVAR